MTVGALCQEPLFPTESRPAEVSVIFNGQHNTRLGDTLPDIIVRSSDDVYFAVHSAQLISTSTNRFAGLLPEKKFQHTASKPLELAVQEPSDVLNSLFCTAYGLPADSRPSSIASIRAMLDALRKYGLTPLDLYIYEGTYIYETALSLAREYPVEVYALAGTYCAEDLAVGASAKMVHLKLCEIEPDLIEAMGSQYLHRLYKLRMERTEQLLRLFFAILIKSHSPKSRCSVAAQHSHRMAFRLACTNLFWKAPDVSRDDISTELDPIVEDVTCEGCKAVMVSETDGILAGFNDLKSTI